VTLPVRRLTSVPAAAEPETPRWWIDQLYRRLVDRAAEVEFYDQYYRGDHPLPWLAPQAADDFRRILRMTRSNYCGLVVDAKAERMQVEGFRTPDAGDGEPGDADADLWRIWQANDLDSDSDLAWTEALVGARSYFMVAPNAEDPRTPLVTVEHASQVIVAYEPGSRRRKRAALKVWLDEWTGGHLATLYLPDGLWKVRADKQQPVLTGTPGVFRAPVWQPRTGDTFEVEPNPVGEVPFTEVTCTPRLLNGTRFFLYDVTDVQDRINKTVADRLMTQDFGAFPQKWAKGWPEEDAAGNPTPKIQIGRDRMVTTDAIDAAFGQWDAAPIDGYSAAKREDVKDIASRTRTPAQDLLGEMNNVNGETIKASQSGHIAVVKQMSRYAGDALERHMRLVQRVAGLPESPAMETIWANPEYRTEGELTDAIIKRVQARLASVRQGREDFGYTQAQIRRLEADDANAAAASGLGAVAALFPPAQGTTAPEQ
jgi:hypothetical protein